MTTDPRAARCCLIIAASIAGVALAVLVLTIIAWIYG